MISVRDPAQMPAVGPVREAEPALEAVRAYCAQCFSACGVVAYVQNGRLVKVEQDRDHPNGGICAKTQAAPELVHNSQRLRYPVRRTRPKGDPDPGWERISWDMALDTISERLNAIKAQHGAEAVAFYHGSVASTGAFDYYPFAERLAAAFGSPNRVTTIHNCSWHRDVGCHYTYGACQPWPHFEESGCIVLWGHNPALSWITHLKRVQEGRRKGAKLIVIDPRRIRLAERADLWLPVRPGTDGALALGLMHVMIAENLYDREFVRDWTNAPFLVREDTGDLLRQRDLTADGAQDKFVVWDESSGSQAIYDPAVVGYQTAGVDAALTGRFSLPLADGQSIQCTPAFQLLTELADEYPPERVEQIAWTPADKIRQAAHMLAEDGPVSYYPFNGVEQQTNATQTSRAICTLYGLTGDFDKQGGNAIFEMPPTKWVTGEGLLPPEMVAKRLGLAERPLGPPNVWGFATSYDLYEAILDEKPYPVKALLSIGGNMLMSNDDSLRGRKALERIEFYAQADFFLTPTASMADIVLPAATFWESPYARHTFFQGPVSHAHMQWRPAVVPPQAESRPDMEIIFDLAVRMGLGDQFWNGDVEAALDDMLSPSGVTVEELRRHPGGLTQDLPVRYQKYRQNDPETGRPSGFPNEIRKLEIFSQTFKDHGYDPLPVFVEPQVSPVSQPEIAEKFPLILTNAKLQYYCHSQYQAVPSLRRKAPEPYLEIHPETASTRDIREGDPVRIETPRGRIKMKAQLTDRTPPGVVCTHPGWWQSCPELDLPGYDPFGDEGANVNLLYSSEVTDPISGSVPMRAYLCEVRKIANGTK